MNETNPSHTAQNKINSPKNLNGLVSLVIKIVVLVTMVATMVAIISYLSNQKEDATTGVVSNTEANISIGPEGYEPQTIKIKSGELVTWTNVDVNGHEIASGPYPANNQLENLNSEEEIQPNDSYSFVFEQPGTYNYHDNTDNPKYQGIVIVE